MSAQKTTRKNSGKRASGSGGAKAATTRKASGNATKKAPPKRGAQSAAKSRAAATVETGGSGLAKEIIGVLIAVIAIAIFIAVVAPGEAILSRGIAGFFRTLIGLGAFIMPFLLLIWAASFFIEKGMAGSTVRLGLGFTLILLSILAIFALTTPAAAAYPEVIFKEEHLVMHGGYVGGGIAWGLLELVGEKIAYVILVGLIIVGVVLIGFSITGLITRVRTWV
ncbi:MAG TPA: hypothetical protein DEB24_06380, partial [Coriobacteriia bacterium]|nr:hypothetical protein [Coriobacteriia bacterium]